MLETMENRIQLWENEKDAKRGQSYVELSEFVVVHRHQLKRNQWKLEKIKKLIRGQNGLVQAAEVVQNYVKRPLAKLYPLDMVLYELSKSFKIEFTNLFLGNYKFINHLLFSIIVILGHIFVGFLYI